MRTILTAMMLAAAAGPAAAQDVAAAACVYKYAGDVRLLEPETSAWINVERGLPLKEGIRLRTGPGASCELLAGDGTFISLSENSETVVEKLRLEADTRDYGFNFIKGRILWLAAKVLRKTSSFTIRTPSAVCAVRGTDFSIDVSSAASEIGLFDGELNISSNGKETVLSAGSEALTAPGAGTRVLPRFSRLMEAERRRYLRLKKHAEDLRKKLAARENFLNELIQARQKRLRDLENRRQEKLEKRR